MDDRIVLDTVCPVDGRCGKILFMLQSSLATIKYLYYLLNNGCANNCYKIVTKTGFKHNYNNTKYIYLYILCIYNLINLSLCLSQGF